MVELFNAGFGCHHAGMLRADRNLVEKVFGQGYIKVKLKISFLIQVTG
jgi:replicative superfamily II helicase